MYIVIRPGHLIDLNVIKGYETLEAAKSRADELRAKYGNNYEVVKVETVYTTRKDG